MSVYKKHLWRSKLRFIIIWHIHDIKKALKDKAVVWDDKPVKNFRASLW